MPAQAGIQRHNDQPANMDSRLRGNDSRSLARLHHTAAPLLRQYTRHPHRSCANTPHPRTVANTPAHRHSRAGGNPAAQRQGTQAWMPACAGMTAARWHGSTTQPRRFCVNTPATRTALAPTHHHPRTVANAPAHRHSRAGGNPAAQRQGTQAWMPAFAGMTAVEGVTVVACHGDALRPLDARHDAVTSPRHNPFVLYACEITGSTSRPPEGGRSIWASDKGL
jgi:hypothetical protein